MPSFKVDRKAEDIKRELTDIFRSIKDPRVNGLLSIVRVELSGDMSYCKVYVSSLEGMETTKQSVAGLKTASGYIKHELGLRLRMRKIPEFKFIADDSIERSADIAKTLNRLKEEDHDAD